MSVFRLIGHGTSLRSLFEAACAWAEEIRIATASIDSDEGRSPVWLALAESKGKRVVATVEGECDRYALDALRRPAALRLIEQEGEFRSNVYYFRRGALVRILVGTARLVASDFDQATNVMIFWEGGREERYASEVWTFIERCYSRAFLPGSGKPVALAEEIEPGQEGASSLRTHTSTQEIEHRVAIFTSGPGAGRRLADTFQRSVPVDTEPSAEQDEGDADEIEVEGEPSRPGEASNRAANTWTPNVADVWACLIGEGPVPKDDGIRHAARLLRDRGLVQFQKLKRAGPLYQSLLKQVENGVKLGRFDRPRKNWIRALETEAKRLEPWMWERCVLEAARLALSPEPELIRFASGLARERFGIEFQKLPSEGIILTALREATARLERAEALIRSSDGSFGLGGFS